MKCRRFWAVLIAVCLVFNCFSVQSKASETGLNGNGMLRVSGRLSHQIPANSSVSLTQAFSLDKGALISYDCTYTPSSASVDFGFLAPDGRFYFINCTDGSIDKSIEVTQRGQYTLVIRNNASSIVTITGTVTY